MAREPRLESPGAPMIAARVRRHVFATGGTGYIGRRALSVLVSRGHTVHALVRARSAAKLPPGCVPVVGDALDASTFIGAVAPADTFLQLVGTPRPSPAKAAEFERVDFASVRESVRAAHSSGVRHFVYLSVAQSASVMRAYVDVRMRGEALVRRSLTPGGGCAATFLRPWYVLGPGHRWPYLLVPVYWVLEAIPSTRQRARALGLVTIEQMVGTIVRTVEEPGEHVRIVDVPAIRALGASSSLAD